MQLKDSVYGSILRYASASVYGSILRYASASVYSHASDNTYSAVSRFVTSLAFEVVYESVYRSVHNSVGRSIYSQAISIIESYDT